MKNVNVFWFSFFAYVLLYTSISFVTLLPVITTTMNGNSKSENSNKKEFKSKKQTANLHEDKTLLFAQSMS